MKYQINDLRSKLDYLRSNRQSLEQQWSRTLRLVKASQDSYSTYSSLAFSGQSITQRGANTRIRPIFDNHGATASLTLSSYLHSNLTNPHDRWMELTEGIVHSLQGPGSVGLQNQDGSEEQVSKEDLMHDIKVHLQSLSNQMHLELQSTNFHQEIFCFYKDIIDIGTACLYTYNVNQYKEKKIIFKCKSMFNIYFLEDSYGMPNHVFCLYTWDARNLVNFFAKGKSEKEIEEMFGQRVFNAYKKWTDEIFTFVHAVYPDYESKIKESYHEEYFLYDSYVPSTSTWDYGAPPKNTENKVSLKSGKIDHLPYIITRIRKESDSQYGTGHSTEATPQLIQLQEIKRSITIGAQKNVEPPMNVPSNRVGVNYSSRPNAQNPYDFINGQIVSVAPSIPHVPLQDSIGVLESIKHDIDKIYLIDKIRIEPVKRNRTATEVEKRTGEEIKLFSPFLGALENEFLVPLAKNTLAILRSRKNSGLKKAFEVLDSINYSIKYVSDIARSQTHKRIQNIIEGMSYVTLISEKDKSVLTKPDWHKVAAKIYEHLNWPFDTLKTPKEFEAAKAAMAKADSEKKALEGMPNVKDAAQASKFTQEAESIRLGREEGPGSEEEQFG